MTTIAPSTELQPQSNLNSPRFDLSPIIERPGNLAVWETETRGHCLDSCGFEGIVRWGNVASGVRTECENYQHRDGAARKVKRQLANLADHIGDLDSIWLGWYLEDADDVPRSRRTSHRFSTQRGRVSRRLGVPVGSVTVHRPGGVALAVSSHAIEVAGILGLREVPVGEGHAVARQHMEAPGLGRVNWAGWKGIAENHGGEKVIGGFTDTLAVFEEMVSRGVPVVWDDGRIRAPADMPGGVFHGQLESAASAVRMARRGR